VKRRRLGADEIAELKREKERKRSEREAAKAKERAQAAVRRANAHRMHTEKTSKGQPALNRQMEMLVQKLQKQKAAETNK
jgi:hypothetical protein